MLGSQGRAGPRMQPGRAAEAKCRAFPTGKVRMEVEIWQSVPAAAVRTGVGVRQEPLAAVRAEVETWQEEPGEIPETAKERWSVRERAAGWRLRRR